MQKVLSDEDDWDPDNDQHRARAKSGIRARGEAVLTPMYKSPYIEE
jgi:hypothetical protein